MTKTYELPNDVMITADVNEKIHAATVSVFALDYLVEAVNKTGQWIKWEYGTHRCSICDNIIGRERYLYCPNCGARMIESED